MCLSPFLLASVTLTFSAQVVKHFAVVPPPLSFSPWALMQPAVCHCALWGERESGDVERMWTEREWAKTLEQGQGKGQEQRLEQGQGLGQGQAKWRGAVAACCYGYGHGALQRSMVYALRNFRFRLLLVAQRSSDADNCSSRSKNSAHTRCQYPPPSLRCANKPLTLCLPSAPLNCNCNFVALLILLLRSFLLLLLFCGCCCSALLPLTRLQVVNFH